MTGKIRVYSLDDNDATGVSIRTLDADDSEVVAWRKPRANVGALVVDITSPQGYRMTTFDLADLLRLAKAQFPEEFEKVASGELDANDEIFAELMRLDTQIQGLIDNAYKVARGDEDHAVWDETFTQVFDGLLCKRAGELFRDLDLTFDWYDPDTSYKEDVTYFARALHDRVETLKPQYPAVSLG